MDAILIKMKWPFATGISSPMMIEKNNEEIMPKFDSIGRLLLKMNPSMYPFENYDTDDDHLIIICLKRFINLFALKNFPSTQGHIQPSPNRGQERKGLGQFSTKFPTIDCKALDPLFEEQLLIV